MLVHQAQLDDYAQQARRIATAARAAGALSAVDWQIAWVAYQHLARFARDARARQPQNCDQPAAQTQTQAPGAEATATTPPITPGMLTQRAAALMEAARAAAQACDRGGLAEAIRELDLLANEARARAQAGLSREAQDYVMRDWAGVVNFTTLARSLRLQNCPRTGAGAVSQPPGAPAPAVSPPAKPWAQDNQLLYRALRLADTADRIDREHLAASESCNIPLMRAKLAELQAIAAELRRIADGAQAAGDLSQIKPDLARGLAEGRERQVREAAQRLPQNCPEASQPSSVPGRQVGSADGARPGSRFGIYAGAAWSSDWFKTTGIGFQRDGAEGEAPERFAGQPSRRVDMLKIGGFASFDIGVPMRFGFAYSQGDESRRFVVDAPPGGALGIVYGDDSPSGSTGIGSPIGGLSGENKVDVEIFDGRVEVPIRIIQAVFLFAQATRVERAHFGSAHFSHQIGNTVFEFSQERRQKLDETWIGAGLGGAIRAPLWSGFFFNLNGSAGVYYRDSEFDSVEHNTNNFTVDVDRDFTVEVSESDSGIGFQGNLAANVEVLVSPNVSIFGGGSVSYRSNVGTIFNPKSGTDVIEGRTTTLRSTDVWVHGVNFGLKVRY